MLDFVQHKRIHKGTFLVIVISSSKAPGTYSADPVDVGGDSGEDSGLFREVAAEAGAKADDTVNLPGTISILAVQGAARVALVI